MYVCLVMCCCIFSNSVCAYVLTGSCFFLLLTVFLWAGFYFLCKPKVIDCGLGYICGFCGFGILTIYVFCNWLFGFMCLASLLL